MQETDYSFLCLNFLENREDFFMFTDWKTFITWERSTEDTIDVKKVYIDMADDLLGGILLSQIVYWYLPSKNGKSKLRVKREGHFWIAKKVKDWYDEIRFSEQNYKTAIKKLEKSDLIIKKRFKFDGAPTTHIRLNIPVFLAKLNSLLESQNTSLDSEDFDDFDSYLLNEIKVNPLSHMDSVKSTESKRLNQPNGNGEINRMETVKSTDSLTENTTEKTTKNTDIHLSRKKVSNEKLNNFIQKNAKRLKDRKININDIIIVFEMNLIEDESIFIIVLDRVIDSYVVNFKSYLKSSLINESESISERLKQENQYNKLLNTKKVSRLEKLPDWYLEYKEENTSDDKYKDYGANFEEEKLKLEKELEEWGMNKKG
jgi:hypothetical protein